MEKFYGFVGKILRIDLTRRKIMKESLNPEIARKFGGGVGYAAKILWDELEPRIDPLSPENKLIMATGPLTGTLCPCSGSWEACFKSPLTNVWGESRCGGGWGPELKYAGFDMVILEGRAEKPVYVWIQDGEAEIRSAEHLAGETVPDTENALKKEVGEYEARVASIGPAGEKLVRFACIMADVDRAAGRCGGGAVMGSKNVKAVAVRGHGQIAIADPEAFLTAVEEAEDVMLKHEWLSPPNFIWRRGTVSVTGSSAVGDLPTKYGSSNSWDKWDDIRRLFDSKYWIGGRACPDCVIGCGVRSEVRIGKWFTPPFGGPEYETTGIFTAFMLNDDLEAAIHASYLCNLYGMDTISCGNVIALAMECREKGWLAKKDTDNVDLTYGNMEAVMEMIKKITQREGFGDILAEGTEKAAEKIGKGAPDIAMHVKGLDIPAHDPRGGKTLALQYGTSNRGACHIHPHETNNYEIYNIDFGLIPYGLPTPAPDALSEKGKGIINKIIQDFGITQDILGVCRFATWAGLTIKHYESITRTLLGWDVNDVELLKIGERVFNLQRCFNAREGRRRKDDQIPKRLREIPAFGKFSNIKEAAIINYDSMLDEYYDVRGWDKETGIPTPNKLEDLGMSDVAAQLSKYE